MNYVSISGPIECIAQIPRCKLYANEHHFNLMYASDKKDRNLSNKKARKVCEETSNALNAINWKRNSFLDWQMLVM